MVLVVIRLIMTNFRNIVIHQTNDKRLFYEIRVEGTTNIENQLSYFVKNSHYFRKVYVLHYHEVTIEAIHN